MIGICLLGYPVPERRCTSGAVRLPTRKTLPHRQQDQQSRVSPSHQLHKHTNGTEKLFQCVSCPIRSTDNIEVEGLFLVKDIGTSQTNSN